MVKISIAERNKNLSVKEYVNETKPYLKDLKSNL